MDRRYPALAIRSPQTDLILAALDDFSPTAIEEHADGLTAYFGDAAARDDAFRTIAPRFDATPIEVPDDDWARRSQENLQPITVGRITVIPNPQSLITNPYAIVVIPSMAFGTGHHATTRLCLAAMQEAGDVGGKTVLDVGTGSGLLALAADRLGAARAIGIDIDADAIASANENLTFNPDARRVTFQLADVTSGALPPADVVVANLTGAMLARSAARLLDSAATGGILILSGFLAEERDAVRRAFDPAPVVWQRQEEEWMAMAVKKA